MPRRRRVPQADLYVLRVPPDTPDTYIHGHHDSVLRSHTWRNVENSAAYLTHLLKAGQTVLDVGCGPGTISVDLAARVAPGQVTAIDADEGVVDKARELLETTGTPNCRFETGDVYALSYADDSFDIVHAHQVLQHLTDPVAALVEMRRVIRPGGLVAIRDAIYAAMSWSPADPLLDRWMDLYHQITDRNSVNAEAGQELFGWVHEAGFATGTASSSTWTFATPDTRAWWGTLWAERVQHSSFATHALEHSLSDPAELQDIASAFRRWAANGNGFFMVPHGEVTAIK